MQETQVQSVGQEDPPEKGMAAHSTVLAWRTPWTRSLVGYSPRGCKESDTTEQLTLSLSIALQIAFPEHLLCARCCVQLITQNNKPVRYV